MTLEISLQELYITNIFLIIVPQLLEKPFKKLQHLAFEGESLSTQLASFLFKSAVNYLETISLAVEEYTPEFKGNLDFKNKIKN